MPILTKKVKNIFWSNVAWEIRNFDNCHLGVRSIKWGNSLVYANLWSISWPRIPWEMLLSFVTKKISTRPDFVSVLLFHDRRSFKFCKVWVYRMSLARRVIHFVALMMELLVLRWLSVLLLIWLILDIISCLAWVRTIRWENWLLMANNRRILRLKRCVFILWDVVIVLKRS